jgi:hypothetical protein
MSKKKTIIWVSFALIIVLIFCIIKVSNNTSKDDDGLCYKTISINKQNVDKRIYSTNKPKIVSCIILDSLEIYRPTFCDIDKYGNIYIFDYSNFDIFKYHTVNNSWERFDIRKGKGPGELINPTDFVIDNEEVYIADPSNGRIEMYSIGGKYLKYIANKAIRPYRIVQINDELLVESTINPAQEGIFYIIEKNQPYNILSNFGFYIYNNSKLNEPSAHDNMLMGLSEGKFCYMSTYLGFIGIYKNDSLLIAKETIDGINMVDIIIQKRGEQLIKTIDRRNSNMTSIESACNDEYIINLSLDKKAKYINIDIYNKNNLDYLISIKNTQKINCIELNNNILVGISDNCLYIYDLVDIFEEIS